MLFSLRSPAQAGRERIGGKRCTRYGTVCMLRGSSGPVSGLRVVVGKNDADARISWRERSGKFCVQSLPYKLYVLLKLEEESVENHGGKEHGNFFRSSPRLTYLPAYVCHSNLTVFFVLILRTTQPRALEDPQKKKDRQDEVRDRRFCASCGLCRCLRPSSHEHPGCHLYQHGCR